MRITTGLDKISIRKKHASDSIKGFVQLEEIAKYDHHCTVPSCGKFGHGAHICRKRIANEGGVNSSSSTISEGKRSTDK